MAKNFTNFAFTDSVKAEQETRGSRASYARREEQDQFKLSHREMGFIDQQHGFYMSTVGENGWPYVQFRGGPTGFLKVIDSEALAYADFSGNMQYISTGNLKASKKAMLFLMDYSTRTRLKIWAETEILEPEHNPDLLEILMDPSYKAKVEQIIVFHIKGFDWNCPQHITPKFTIDQMKDLVKKYPDLLEELNKAAEV